MKIYSLLLAVFFLSACQNSSKETENQVLEKLKAGQFKEAASLAAERLKDNPDLELLHNYKGIAHFELKEYDEAIRCFDAAIKLNDKSYKYYFNRANAFRASNKAGEALNDYEKASQLDPSHYDIFLNKGLTLLQLEKQEEALASFNKAVELNQKDAKPFFYRAKLLMVKQLYSDALEDLQKALQLDAKDLETKSFYGICQIKLGKKDEGCQVLQECAKAGFVEAETALADYCK